MRVIGRIEPKLTNYGQEIENPEYIDGKIVELTSREVSILKLLQDACNGERWRGVPLIEYYQRFGNLELKDVNMSEAFAMVYTFATTRLAINDFKATVVELDKIINKTDSVSEL